jgi:hypothetical protein
LLLWTFVSRFLFLVDRRLTSFCLLSLCRSYNVILLLTEAPATHIYVCTQSQLCCRYAKFVVQITLIFFFFHRHILLKTRNVLEVGSNAFIKKNTKTAKPDLLRPVRDTNFDVQTAPFCRPSRPCCVIFDTIWL